MSQTTLSKNVKAIEERATHTILAALRHWQRTSHVMELDEIASNGGEVEPLNDHEIDDLCELFNSELYVPADDVSEPQNTHVSDLLFVGCAEVRQWLIAALFFWRQEGQCDPVNRTDGIHAIATGNDQFTSAAESDIDELLIKLHSDQDPAQFLAELAGSIGAGAGAGAARHPVVVVELNGGLIQCVRTSTPVDVVTVDYDTEGADEDALTQFFEEEAVVSMRHLHERVTGGHEGVNPEFCEQVVEIALSGQ